MPSTSPALLAKNWRDLIRPKTLDVEKETLSGLWDPNVFACLAALVRRDPAGAARRTGDGVPITLR